LQVTWPERPAGHSRVQTLYVSDDGLIRRFDYQIDVAGGARGARLLDGYADIAGIMVLSNHKIYARDDQDNVILEQLMVSIDVDQVKFVER
jgi:hypothetical protein